MTVETTATKQAAVTPVRACSSNATAAAVSRSTGPATETTTAATTATRRAPTAPTRVSVLPSLACFPSLQRHLAPRQFHSTENIWSRRSFVVELFKEESDFTSSIPVWFQTPHPGGEYFKNADLSSLKYCFLCSTRLRIFTPHF